MALSPLPPSKRSPHASSSKLNQRKSKKLKNKLFSRKELPNVVKYYKAVKIKEEQIDNLGKPIICYQRKVNKSNASLAVGEAKLSALDRANEVQAKLPSECPSFVKLMLPSHVAGGFWLGLPKEFCNSHLPKHDETVILVDEGEDEHATKYLAEKNGLSAGWRGFSIAHKLREGDVVVFQLIKLCRFMVYIVRAHRLAEIDGAISLLNLDIQAKSIRSAQNENQIEEVKTAGHKTLEPPVETSDRDDNQVKSAVALSSDPALEPSGDESDGFAEVLDGIRFSEGGVEFKDVESFQSFTILVDGLIIDSQIPIHVRTKYYELCCSQNCFLHDHLVKGLNCKLAAGIISETVNIAEAIRAAKLSTSSDYLQTWDKTLKAFEDMGMTVGFLRERLKKLVCLEIEQRQIIESKTFERAQVEQEMKDLEVKISNVKETMRTIDAEIQALKEKHQMQGLTFKEMAAAPW